MPLANGVATVKLTADARHRRNPMEALLSVHNLPLGQSAFPQERDECPDQRIWNLFIGETLRLKSKTKLLNRAHQKPSLEYPRIFLSKEAVEIHETVDPLLQAHLPRWLLEEIEGGDL